MGKTTHTVSMLLCNAEWSMQHLYLNVSTTHPCALKKVGIMCQMAADERCEWGVTHSFGSDWCAGVQVEKRRIELWNGGGGFILPATLCSWWPTRLNTGYLTKKRFWLFFFCTYVPWLWHCVYAVYLQCHSNVFSQPMLFRNVNL